MLLLPLKRKPMKTRIKALCLTVILLLSVTVPAKAASEHDAASEAGNILEYVMSEAGTDDCSQYMDTGLIPYAGNGAEWNVISMKVMGMNVDYEGFNTALNEFLEENDVLKATDCERIALAKAVMGYNDDWVDKAVSGYADSNTIMSLIYGLMAADCVNHETGSEIAAKLIEMQLDDGGFSLMGDFGDPDVTAMALQALAPFYGTYKNEIERAIQCLSDMQRSTGGYAGCGIENVESSAQVLMALCALNIDYRNDSRFIKNGNTVFDAMMAYRCEGGGYSHTSDTGVNKLATTQALLAMACAAGYDEGKSFVFSSGFCMETERGETESENETVTETRSESESALSSGMDAGADGGRPYITGKAIKIIMMSVVAAAGIAFVVTAIIRKRGRKRIPVTILVTAAIVTVIGFLRIESREEHYAAASCGDVVTHIEAEGVDGVILIPDTEVMIYDGDSVFDQLKNAVTAMKINIDYTGSEALGTVYVRSIGGLAEFDYGSMSGWTYTVNDKYPEVSCSAYKLEPEDKVKWIYQTEYSELR